MKKRYYFIITTPDCKKFGKVTTCTDHEAAQIARDYARDNAICDYYTRQSWQSFDAFMWFIRRGIGFQESFTEK